MDADPGQQTFFAEQAIVGYAVEFEQVIENALLRMRRESTVPLGLYFAGMRRCVSSRSIDVMGMRMRWPGEQAWI